MSRTASRTGSKSKAVYPARSGPTQILVQFGSWAGRYTGDREHGTARKPPRRRLPHERAQKSVPC